MRKGKLVFFVIAYFISVYGIAQEKEFTITKNPNDGSCNAFEVVEKRMNVTTHESKEVDNPKYLEMLSQIDSLKNVADLIIKPIENDLNLALDSMKAVSQKMESKLTRELDSLNVIISEIENERLTPQIAENLNTAQQYLKRAIENANKNSSAPLSFDEALAYKKKKWNDLIEAKKYLDKSGIIFEQSTKGKYSKALEQAETNFNKINGLFKNDELAVAKINTVKDVYNEKIKISEKLQNQNESNAKVLQKQYKEKVDRLQSVVVTKINKLKHQNISKKTFIAVPVGEIERNVVFIDASINVGNTLTGVFVSFNNRYGIDYSPNYQLMEANYDIFSKDELVPMDSIKKYFIDDTKRREVSENIGNYDFRYNSNNTYLFRDVKNDKLYFTNDNILGRCAVDKELYDALTFLQESGGTFYTKDGSIIVEYKGEKCKFTNIVKEQMLKKDLSIIAKMSKSVKQHKIYKDQASDLATIMMNQMSAYYSITITTVGLAKWKTATQECSTLIKKMGQLPYASEREYYDQCSAENEKGLKYSDIVDVITTSKQLLSL